MGLCISYTAKLAKRDAIDAFFTVARREARSRGWKVPRAKAGGPALTLLPHADCEPVVFDFSRSLTCEHFVKTSSAPLRTHVEIVEFLRAVEPLLKSLTVEDECEYWETGDRRLLKQHRDGFGLAIGVKQPKSTDPPITFTLGAYTISSDGVLRATGSRPSPSGGKRKGRTTPPS